MNTLILGVGNPILRDDGAGIKIAQKIKAENPDLEVIETSEAGIVLLDLIIGYERLIIIDSIKTGRGRPGELYKLQLADLKPNMDFSSSHAIDVATALKLGQMLGNRMPGSVTIYAVEIKDNTTFGEECTPEVEDRIPAIASQIIRQEKLNRK